MPPNPPHRRPRRALRRGLLAAAGVLVLVGAVVVPNGFASTGSSDGADTTATSALPAKYAAPDEFTHPGVHVGEDQLDFVKEKLAADEQPWTSAYEEMLDSEYADQDRQPQPREVVECGSYSDPDYGCTDEREDAIAAYTNALAWYFSGDEKYAEKAIEIMDAWSDVIQDHTNSNAPLQTGWAGSVWPRAAEIIRYSYDSWPNVDRFETMLSDVYLPTVIKGSQSNGNWELTMLEAAVGISVFLDDAQSYDTAVEKFLGRVPAYVYLESDGDLPKTAPGSGLETPDDIIGYWQGQSTFVDGLTQETCRDFTHTGYGLSSISHVAETSYLQGQSLYPEVGERLQQGLGFQAGYELGEDVPDWLCDGSVETGLGPVTEVGFNALHTRGGAEMTNTQKLTENQRPAGSNNLFVAWETLTHAENPS